jgi:MFS family permease
MMPLSLLRNLDFAGANALTVLLYAALNGALFLLPFMLIQVHGYSAIYDLLEHEGLCWGESTATAAGAALLPFAAIMGVGSHWAGGLVERVGTRAPLTFGPALTAAGYATLGFSGDNPSYWTGFLPGLIVVSFGMTLCVAPLAAAVFDAAPNEKSGTASGINNAAARAGGLVAVAALGLAFGGPGAAGIKPANLSEAYRLVMFGAAALAGSSALTAALTIGIRNKLHRAQD